MSIKSQGSLKSPKEILFQICRAAAYMQAFR